MRVGEIIGEYFSAQEKSIELRETKGGDQDKCKTVTNIFISFFSEVTSVQHNFKIIRGNYGSVQSTILTIWVDQATQGEVEAVDPEKVVEEEEDGTKRRILTWIRRILPTKNSYSPYYKVLSMSGCLHMKPL